jgi:hypothetical protein
MLTETGSRVFTRPPSIPNNILVYDTLAEKKANEIVEILRSQIKFKEVRPYRVGDPLPLSLTVTWVTAGVPATQRIAIYLVEKV